MSFIRTILGDILPQDLGVCYAHEHLVIDDSFATEKNPDFLLDSVANGAAELRELKQLGVGACVDSMPVGCGANLEKLAAISRQSGVHILAPTGLHLAKYYAPHENSELEKWDSKRLQHRFEQEIKNGPRRCGLIKVAALENWDARTKNAFQAAAAASQSTGAPILTHTEEGKLAFEQALFLQQHGADLHHVVLSHLDRNPDFDVHRKVLKTGVTIEYDSHFRTKKTPNPTLELLTTLLPEFPDQIVLGMDAARRSYWKHYGGAPGLAFLYGDFKNQMLGAGISHELIHKVFVATPARVYSFRK